MKFESKLSLSTSAPFECESEDSDDQFSNPVKNRIPSPLIRSSLLLLNLAAKLVLSQVYEDTQIDQPFDLGHNIDHAIVEPGSLKVFIKK
jgi:hypothetical protein